MCSVLLFVFVIEICIVCRHGMLYILGWSVWNVNTFRFSVACGRLTLRRKMFRLYPWRRVVPRGWKWRPVVQRIAVMLRVIFIYRLQQKIVGADTVLLSKSALYVATIEGHFTANSAFTKAVLFILIPITPRGTETQSNTASVYRHIIYIRLVLNISLSSADSLWFWVELLFFCHARRLVIFLFQL